MMFMVEAQLKCGVTQREIQQVRKRWATQGKERRLKSLCRSAQRYVVAGSSPRRVFWLLETKDPATVELLADHFGELWNLTTWVVLPQTIIQAVGR